MILRDDASEPDASGNIFLTNIHQLYESRVQDWVAANPVDAMLGRAPAKDLSSYQRSMLERVKEPKDLVIINDEAHHVHDEDLAWSQSLLGIHKTLPKGASLWLDFSATPRDQNRIHFAWTICDYPLAQAVEDRIVKAPIIVTKEDDPLQPPEPEEITRDNVVEKYDYWIRAAVQRWQQHFKTYKKLKKKPVLFVMAEKNVFADAIGAHLVETPEFGLRPSEVKVIHTDKEGDITKKDLEEARTLVRDIDKPGNRDVLRFASLGTTQQGDSASAFRVDYLKLSGAIGFYHPDWVVVQKAGKKEVNWIIETKGRLRLPLLSGHQSPAIAAIRKCVLFVPRPLIGRKPI